MSLQARAWATSALSHLPCRPAPTTIDGGPREAVADLGGADLRPQASIAWRPP